MFECCFFFFNEKVCIIKIFDKSMHSGAWCAISHTNRYFAHFISAHAKALSKFMLYSAVLPKEKKL